jgi:hypothetical protein
MNLATDEYGSTGLAEARWTRMGWIEARTPRLSWPEELEGSKDISKTL